MAGTLNHIPPIPMNIYSQAQAVFGNENVYLLIGDQLEMLLECDQQLRVPSSRAPCSACEHLFSTASLALITILQYQEGLTDQQAANALRSRLDWKYALHLPALHVGIDEMALCCFRRCLLFTSEHYQIYKTVYRRIYQAGIFAAPEYAGDENELLATVCLKNRLEWAGQVFSQALSALAAADSEWLRHHALPGWNFREKKTGPLPQNHRLLEKLKDDFRSIGVDTHGLLVKAARHPSKKSNPRELALLQQMFDEQFFVNEAGKTTSQSHCSFCQLVGISSSPGKGLPIR